jgi:hypothetical protein
MERMVASYGPVVDFFQIAIAGESVPQMADPWSNLRRAGGPAQAARGLLRTILRRRRRLDLVWGGSDRPVPQRRQLRRSHPQGREAGELPVQAPSKYELVINLKSAKALGLDVSPTLLARRYFLERHDAAPRQQRC